MMSEAMNIRWISVGRIADIPRQGARTVGRRGGADIGVFRTLDNRIFALEDRCPHKHGPLSQGIVHGHSVACPLHNWRISLETGKALGEDTGCTPVIPLKIVEDEIFLGLETIETPA